MSEIKNSDDDFYESLNSFKDFAEFHQDEFYTSLPDDWCVVVTDIRGSTKAIEAGRYKEVNAIGVSSIVAILNAVKPLKVPYVFGGDGATVCFPVSALRKVSRSLALAKHLAENSFSMELRIGVVRLKTIRKAGHNIQVAKYQPHKHYQQAMFRGNGLGYAEKLIKDPDPANPYLIQDETIEADSSCFDGFECRWKDIPSPHAENISLLVQALSSDAQQQTEIYSKIISHINEIYGKESRYSPLREDQLKLTANPALLSIEARIRNLFESTWTKFFYQNIKLQFLRLAGNWLMRKSDSNKDTKWKNYKQNLIKNSDYQKFDEALRMIISGDEKQRAKLRVLLEHYHQQGQIVFGIHVSRSALITCIINDYDKDHVHFIDGSNGGYAMAAREMKKQLNEISASVKNL